MASNITLSASVRQNLLSLQSTAQLMSMTQNRLATGKKVNTALDNPTNFFTSAALKSRAGDLSALLDSMSNAINTIQAANNGITSITKLVQSARESTESIQCYSGEERARIYILSYMTGLRRGYWGESTLKTGNIQSGLLKYS